MTGTVGILNVGAGDVELRFDQNDPAETIRAGRIVKDMLRRGFALMVEVERDGEKVFERALDFDEKTHRYIIADFDPVAAALSDAGAAAEAELDSAVMARAEEDRRLREQHGKAEDIEAAPPEAGTGEVEVKLKGRRGRPRREVDATGTRAVAVGRSAGG